MKYTVKEGDDGDKEWSQSRIQKKKSKAYCEHTKVNFKTDLHYPNKTHIFVAIQILDIRYEVLQGFR